MLLPVQEMLTKTLLAPQSIIDQPVVWRDRNHYVIANNGRLEVHELAGQRIVLTPFTAWVSVTPGFVDQPATSNAPAAASSPSVVLRAARILDVERQQYLTATDIRLEQGVILRNYAAARIGRTGRLILEMLPLSLAWSGCASAQCRRWPIYQRTAGGRHHIDCRHSRRQRRTIDRSRRRQAAASPAGRPRYPRHKSTA